MSLSRVAYGVYAWMILALLGVGALPALLLMRSLPRRRALVRALARLLLRLIGMRVLVRNLCGLPLPCIVVANHGSYLDGVVLVAVLPPSFSFVIKREMSAVPFAGTLLRRIGVEFVERFDRARSARDTRRLLRNAASGQAQVFFPEGTFSGEIGLLRFHIGAFAAAARANLAVVPIAIRGTRRRLPPGTVWPRPGAVEVEALATLPAMPGERDAHGEHGGERAARLRDSARAALLHALGEPDLQARDG
jgi:1-acyl-sn-glycerol-3-phosphate acyltransferase